MKTENNAALSGEEGAMDPAASAAPASSQAQRFHARFIRAGALRALPGGKSRLSISAEALQAAAQEGKFDQLAVFLDHPRYLEHPSLSRLIGYTRQASFNPGTQAVEGEIELLQNAVAAHAQSLVQASLANPELDIGLSLVFYPEWEEGQPGAVRRMQAVDSLDLVFQPAAGGRFLQALDAVNQEQGERLCVIEPVQPENLSKIVSIHHQNEQGDDKAMNQMEASESKDQAPCEMQGSAANPIAVPASWLSAVRQATSESMLAASGLPEAARQRLSSQEYGSPEDVAQAISREREYLAQLAQDQVIQLPGQPPRSPSISGMRSPLDRLELAFDALLNGVRPPEGIQPLTGIREFYHHLSGDYEMTGQFQPERIQLAAVNSSTMANMTANVLNKRLVNEFKQYPRWWEPVVLAEDFSSLQAVKWITLGGVGELPTVAEGAAYTELSWDDSAESASFVKKGGYLGITLETIDKDDTARVRAAPRALAQAAWLTLSKTISAIFTASSGVGPLISDGTALFTSGHGNLGSTALSVTSYNAARLAMRKQTELNSAERLGALTAPKYLLVPPDLEITALQVLASEYDYTYALSNGTAAPVNVLTQGNDFQARMNFARSRVIVVDLWTDTNDWAASADPRLYPTIGLAFRYGRMPEIFSVASPTAGLMFTNDTMPVKVRFFFAAGPMDYRGLYKANVS